MIVLQLEFRGWRGEQLHNRSAIGVDFLFAGGQDQDKIRR
jgi:hypothetical protein